MILSTDSTANLPINLYKELNISMIPLQIVLDSEIYDDLSEKLPPKQFYAKMKAGANPKTAQVNEGDAREYFEGLLAKNEDVLHISFSSALSGNTATIIKIADELNKTHKNKVYVIDSLNASMGEGMLVLYAKELMDKNTPIKEIVEKVSSVRKNSCAFFTVEKLSYLVRGGRVSKAKGVIGTILNIKPILRVSEEGKLVEYKKVMSRKKSIAELVNICVGQMKSKKYVYVGHTDCEDEAKQLATALEEQIHIRPQIIELTQVIGAHTGPGLLAVFFFKTEI